MKNLHKFVQKVAKVDIYCMGLSWIGLICLIFLGYFLALSLLVLSGSAWAFAGLVRECKDLSCLVLVRACQGLLGLVCACIGYLGFLRLVWSCLVMAEQQLFS
jgi:hypothetical protein